MKTNLLHKQQKMIYRTHLDGKKITTDDKRSFVESHIMAMVDFPTEKLISMMKIAIPC